MQKVLPGCIRKLTWADIKAHCAGGPIPVGQEPAGAGHATKENVLPTHGATVTDKNQPVGLTNSGKKHKADGGGESR